MGSLEQPHENEQFLDPPVRHATGGERQRAEVVAS